mmetsp:Transcript_16962/g.41666  ORF Transcript_16962/g.41666 Transcript_16962/m.41666 type:complete len:427 (-) Transcript_16962:1584-2864(-)
MRERSGGRLKRTKAAVARAFKALWGGIMHVIGSPKRALRWETKMPITAVQFARLIENNRTFAFLMLLAAVCLPLTGLVLFQTENTLFPLQGSLVPANPVDIARALSGGGNSTFKPYNVRLSESLKREEAAEKAAAEGQDPLQAMEAAAIAADDRDRLAEEAMRKFDDGMHGVEEAEVGAAAGAGAATVAAGGEAAGRAEAARNHRVVQKHKLRPSLDTVMTNAGKKVRPNEVKDLTRTWHGVVAVIVFVVGYILAIMEESIGQGFKKSIPITVSAGIIWVLVALGYRDKGHSIALVTQAARHNLTEFVEVFLFLLCAMTFINTMQHLNVFARMRSLLVEGGFSYRAIFWVGWRKLNLAVSKRLVSALETNIWYTSFKSCAVQFQAVPLLSNLVHNFKRTWCQVLKLKCDIPLSPLLSIATCAPTSG